MKESLKLRLNNWIQAQRGKVVPLNQIELLCKQWGYKPSNAERRLRPSESPNIAPHWNQTHTAIIGYYYRPSAIANNLSEVLTAPLTYLGTNKPYHSEGS